MTGPIDIVPRRLIATEQTLDALNEAVSGLEGAAATLEFALKRAGEALPAGIRTTSSMEERMALKEARLDAARWAFGGKDNLHAEGARGQLEALRRLLGSFTDPTIGRLRECLETIANPNAQNLEHAGVFCRKAALLLLPEQRNLYKEAETLALHRYWLEGMSVPAYRKIWDLASGTPRHHPILTPDFFRSEKEATSASRCGSMLKIAMLLDPDFRATVERVPLPEETPERTEARKKLTELGRFSFGDDTMTHRNATGFYGDMLLTQRALDEMGFSGQLDVRRGGRFEPQGAFNQGAQWRSLQELQALLEQGDPRAMRILQALQVASVKNGFHVVGEFFDNCGRDLIGLDDSVCWTIDSLNLGRAEYYGSHKVSLRIDQVPDAVVSLGDDVMVNWGTRPEAAVQYANGLISLNQFRELVLDGISFDAGGNPVWHPPEFGPFLTNDTRFEIQTRGCVVFPESSHRG